MPKYYCFEGSSSYLSGLMYGHEAKILYIRDYEKDAKSGRFIPLKIPREDPEQDPQLVGYCPTHGVVFVSPRQYYWREGDD